MDKIYLIANFSLVFLCSPNQTNENPPLPNNFRFSNYGGNLSPNYYHSSSDISHNTRGCTFYY